MSEKAESYPQKRTAKFTRRKNGNSRNKTIKTIKNSPKTSGKQPKTRQNNGFCSTWNKCGQLIVSRETYKTNTYQNRQNIPLFHVKRRFRKMWISFNHFASKLTHCQPIDIIVLRKLTKKKVFMATDLNYIKYVVEQIDLPDISFKKMFGEYMVYYKAVPVLLVCDDCVFVKILKETSELLGEDCEQEIPYDGAKLHYVLDIDNSDLARQTVFAVYNCRKDKPMKSK